RSIVSSSELQMSLFKMSTALTVVTTSLAVQEFKLLGQVALGNGTGLIAATALTGVANTPAITAIAASPPPPHPPPHMQAFDAILVDVQPTPFPPESTMSIFPSMRI